MRAFLRVSALATIALLCGAAIAVAQQFGTAAEAKAMLEKATAALKANATEAVTKFNDKAGGFRDRDLYVFCYNISDGKFTAHPNPALMGTDIRALKVKDDPLGQKIYDMTKEGAVTSVNYNFPKPGTTDPVAKESFLTRVGGQGCGVGYYK
jgi:signal transduction histidine kinase